MTILQLKYLNTYDDILFNFFTTLWLDLSKFTLITGSLQKFQMSAEADEQMQEGLLNSQENHPEPESNAIPNRTEYTITSDCCCCFPPCAKIVMPDGAIRKFWGSHELDIGMNIFVICLIVFVELVHFFCVFPKYRRLEYQIPSEILNGVFLILFLWSYFGAACSDPGFLPFNWIQTRKFHYGWADLLSGLAITSSQFEYAIKHRPTGASFSKSSGRFVVRADHICGWVGNWIGKRNHKQFILMLLWGAIYALNLLLWHIPIIKSFYEDGKFYITILMFFEGCVELTFAGLLFYTFFVNLEELRQDMTQIRKWKKEKGHDYDCMRAMQEVCGQSSVFCWIIPTKAFGEDLFLDDEIDYPTTTDNLE
ncbi:DHHC zinc finger domain containing protein [Tritrichomonas foetus]|uniref:Palmitoyltransferase n=1 Tax=Tritrichomonas foetus TaxID=1144522 RepID=A0A1J4KUW6_9EUKA|nr:DHHC zinc finger domain containing protein [Tritrichomonas foetus]|eukprot:OHT14664.1 DHHC zinc finger domain containing protein [Tritrichomonas foetus]